MLLLHTNAFFRLVYTRPQGQFFQYLGYAFQSSSAGTPDPSTVERRKNKQKEYETVIKMSLAPDVVDGAERSSGDVFLVKRNRSVITKKHAVPPVGQFWNHQHFCRQCMASMTS